MIIPHGDEPDRACIKCGQPITGRRIDWWIGTHLHHFHAECAYETGWRLHKNAGKLMKRECKNRGKQ